MIIINENEHLKIIASIIEYRATNMLRTQSLISKDIDALYLSKSKRTQDKICENIYIKLEYIEILLSKIIDDIMSVEIIEFDKMSPFIPEECTHENKDHDNHSYQ